MIPITGRFPTTCGEPLGCATCSVLLGPSRHFWVHKHQGLHHRQPNVTEWDDDLETRGYLRLSPETQWEPRHRRQEIKALFYYGLNSLEWVFLKDFQCLARGVNEWHAVRLSSQEDGAACLQEPLHARFRRAALYPLAGNVSLTAFAMFHVVLSWALAAVFQLAISRLNAFRRGSSGR